VLGRDFENSLSQSLTRVAHTSPLRPRSSRQRRLALEFTWPQPQACTPCRWHSERRSPGACTKEPRPCLVLCSVQRAGPWLAAARCSQSRK
jgi:hypothetical protein